MLPAPPAATCLQILEITMLSGRTVSTMLAFSGRVETLGVSAPGRSTIREQYTCALLAGTSLHLTRCRSTSGMYYKDLQPPMAGAQHFREQQVKAVRHDILGLACMRQSGMNLHWSSVSSTSAWKSCLPRSKLSRHI